MNDHDRVVLCRNRRVLTVGWWTLAGAAANLYPALLWDTRAERTVTAVAFLAAAIMITALLAADRRYRRRIQ